MADKKNSLGMDTLCIHGGHTPESNRAHLTPIYASSTYTFDSAEQSIALFKGEEKGYIYSRWGNPTISEAEEKRSFAWWHLTNEHDFESLTRLGGVKILRVFLHPRCYLTQLLIIRDKWVFFEGSALAASAVKVWVEVGFSREIFYSLIHLKFLNIYCFSQF